MICIYVYWEMEFPMVFPKALLSLIYIVCGIHCHFLSELRNVNFVLLTFNFLRGYFWGHEWFLKANSSTRYVLGRSQCLLWYSSWKFLVKRQWPHSNMKRWLSTKMFVVCNELTIFLGWYITIQSNFRLFWLEIVSYLWTHFLTLKCMIIPNTILKFGL